MAEPKLIKICLTNRGADTETPWAHELGPAPNAPPGSLRVKLVNVPFMHAKPTWGDTIVVTPNPGNSNFPTWDRDGVPWRQISTRIVEDGGRWAMIIDYLPRGANNDEAFAALGRACESAKIICEGAWGPRDNDPGRAYLAVQKDLNAEHVMAVLEGANLPLQLFQIHPEPKKKPAPTPTPRAQTVVGISDDAGRPPAKRASTEPPAPPEPSARRAATQPGAANASSALKKGAKAASKAAAKEAAAAEKAAAKEAAAAAKAAAAKKAAAEKAAVQKAAAKAAKEAVKAALAAKPKAKAKAAAAPKAKAKPAKKSVKKK